MQINFQSKNNSQDITKFVYLIKKYFGLVLYFYSINIFKKWQQSPTRYVFKSLKIHICYNPKICIKIKNTYKKTTIVLHTNKPYYIQRSVC